MRTLLVALLSGLLGAAAGFVGGDITTRAHHVSNMEGGRGMLVVFAIVPACIVAGIIVGVVAARLIPAPGLGGWFKAQLAAWAAVAILAGVVFGYAWMRAPRPPLLNGQELVLEFEVRMPAGRAAPDSAGKFSVLFTSKGYGDDRHLAILHLDRLGSSEGRVVIPASAAIRTTTMQRSLVVNDENGDYFWFDLPLRARPADGDLEWTDWWPRPGEVATADIRGNGGFQIRYRVRPADR